VAPTPRYAVLDAPSILGLRPTGVERLPQALRAAGLLAGLQAEDAGRVPDLNDRYDPVRDPTTGLLNGEALRDFSHRLAGAVGRLLDGGRFPVVLGGDCSILLGALLARRRRGRTGLVFLDAHADFYQPAAEPSGEVASMELALATGRGPAVLSDLDGLRPLVRDGDVALLGYRDAAEARAAGSQDVRATAMHVRDLWEVRAAGAAAAAAGAVRALSGAGPAGFWVHLDADVLDDAVLPAVDYRLPDGLRPAELRAVLRTLLASGRAVGLTVTILNPALDPGGGAARALAAVLSGGLTDGESGEDSSPEPTGHPVVT
jgi:arginase